MRSQDREILRSRFYLPDLGFKLRIESTCDLGFWRSYDVPSCVVTTDLAILKGEVPRGLVCSQKKDHIEAINNQKDFEINLNSLRALLMLGRARVERLSLRLQLRLRLVFLMLLGLMIRLRLIWGFGFA